MVDYQGPHLDTTFHALADATRRQMLERLAADGRLSAGELAAPFQMSLPAVLKHLAVLEAAGLVRREKIGRVVHCELTAGPLREANDWLGFYERFWSSSLDRLKTYLESEQCPPRDPQPAAPKPPPQQPQPETPGRRRRASKSSGPSKLRRKGSSTR
jgi:DNA-binding transcriptional ArsR family regulator